MKLDVRHLELLAAVVAHGGVTEGATALGKSQPSVSRTLAALEARVGQDLFVPGRRPLQPTELGRALAEQGAAIFEAGRKAGDTVEQYRQGRSGAIRIGGTPFFMDGVVSGMVAEFQVQNPDVRIQQSYDFAPNLLRQLADGTLDLAICPMRPDTVPAGYEFTPILPGRNVVACRKGHPLLRKRGVQAEEIFRYPWIAPPIDSPLYADLKLTLSTMGAKDFKISFSGGTLASVLAILVGSDALTVLPYSVVFLTGRRNDIAALRIKINHPDRALGILRPAGVLQSPATDRFRTFVQSRFTQLSQLIQHSEKDVLWRGERSTPR
jgi:DNA-binding transcriptional LysR family regulator